ncbi:FeoB-associated Cys-rich membrane protein [Sedimentibacter sp. MB31-C6]|uniref:FeoB-associated Cys-rich membrane protein n=1 Tax=Sedimentibacter sp. MB31-C6 TaxID=3109366 RepID=UPI002DDD6CE3|nr:FeoB-associated Cys-rich membrane protein [Sedimentibacter sp. MB36-C1]WSI03465.1 FeoB-associated Cys-rich membrane protein [Sedimentibacter sp. MB36-C1]
MGNLIITIIILAIVASAIAKIVIEKRKGAKCIGCPYSQTGESHCGCNNSSEKSKG